MELKLTQGIYHSSFSRVGFYWDNVLKYMKRDDTVTGIPNVKDSLNLISSRLQKQIKKEIVWAGNTRVAKCYSNSEINTRTIISWIHESMVSFVSRRYMRGENGKDSLMVCLSEYQINMVFKIMSYRSTWCPQCKRRSNHEINGYVYSPWGCP